MPFAKPTKERRATLITWIRKSDGKIFFHAEEKGRPISHRFGPFDKMDELVPFAQNPTPNKDCGPVGDHHIAPLRRGIEILKSSAGNG